MALPFRTSRAIVGIRPEVAAGSYLEPSGAQSFHAVNISFTPSQQTFERKDTSATFGIRDSIPGAVEGDISFEIPLVGSSAIGTAPFWEVPFMACGHQRGNLIIAATAFAAGAVTVGQIFANGTKLYVVTAQGGNAVTAPSHTGVGTTAVDAGSPTVFYRYIGETATTWSASTVTAGTVYKVTTDNTVYMCVVGGTAVTKPTGTAYSLVVDSTIEYRYLGQSTGTNGVGIAYRPGSIFDGSAIQVTQNYVWTAPVEGYSVAVWLDDRGGVNGLQMALTGCQGDVSISTKQGEPLIAKFKLHGAYFAVSNDTQPVVTDSPLVPPTCLGASIWVHGVSSLAFDGFEFTKGNTLNKRGDVSAASGVRSAWITGHKPMIKASPEITLTGTLDFYARWRAGTAHATQGFVCDMASAGAAGQRFCFVAPRTQIRDLSLGDREGAVTAECSMAVTTLPGSADGSDYYLQLC